MSQGRPLDRASTLSLLGIARQRKLILSGKPRSRVRIIGSFSNADSDGGRAPCKKKRIIFYLRMSQLWKSV